MLYEYLCWMLTIRRTPRSSDLGCSSFCHACMKNKMSRWYFDFRVVVEVVLSFVLEAVWCGSFVDVSLTLERTLHLRLVSTLRFFSTLRAGAVDSQFAKCSRINGHACRRRGRIYSRDAMRRQNCNLIYIGWHFAPMCCDDVPMRPAFGWKIRFSSCGGGASRFNAQIINLVPSALVALLLLRVL